jgi:hypothetical protein
MVNINSCQDFRCYTRVKDEFARLSRPHQAGNFQHPQVLRDGGDRLMQDIGQIADATLLYGQDVEDCQPAGVGHCFIAISQGCETILAGNMLL